MEHSFDIEIAKEYGMFEAVLLKHLYYWIEKNKANGKHLHDGKYWTYNSVNAFTELFPYVSAKKIRNTLNRLIDFELVETGNFNTLSFDRTTWYTLTDKGMSMFPKGQMTFDQKGKPIPNNKTYSYKEIYKEKIEEIISYLNKKTENNFKSNTKTTVEYIIGRLNEGYTIEDFKKVIDNKVNDWKDDPNNDAYLRPSTLFRPSNFENYLNQKIIPKQPKENSSKGLSIYEQLKQYG